MADGSEESTGNESLQITALDNEVDEAVSVQPIEVAGFLDDKNELATEGGLLATGDGIVTGMISDDEMIMILNIYRDPTNNSFVGAGVNTNNNYGVFRNDYDPKGIDGIVGFGTSSEVSGRYYAAGAFYNEAIDMVDQLLAGASSPTYNYSGGFIGEVTNTNGLLLGEITSSSLNLAITFGPELDISGDGSFVANGNLWSFDIFSNDGIEYLSVEGNGSADVSNIGGQMNGRFFGKDLEGVGGVYELTGTVVNEDLTATGAFKGTR